MCTAITYKSNNFYFGRTLDYEFSYGEEIVIMPRDFSIHFTSPVNTSEQFAVIGTAHIEDGYPLFYDAANEKGLAMAGLNFVGNAHFNKHTSGACNVSQFEFIPWILCQCESVSQAKLLISNINITDTPFSEKLPASPLHWILADKNQCITIESLSSGLKIYENPVGVLTNNPSFEQQLFRLNDFMSLSCKNPKNTFSEKLNLCAYSRGMGALGLPGDWSSQSRFIKASFVSANSLTDISNDDISQFFHILSSVEQPYGCCHVENGYEYTIYTSCYNTDKGIYYFTTYNNRQISAVCMHNENLNASSLISFKMGHSEQIKYMN